MTESVFTLKVGHDDLGIVVLVVGGRPVLCRRDWAGGICVGDKGVDNRVGRRLNRVKEVDEMSINEVVNKLCCEAKWATSGEGLGEGRGATLRGNGGYQSRGCVVTMEEFLQGEWSRKYSARVGSERDAKTRGIARSWGLH